MNFQANLLIQSKIHGLIFMWLKNYKISLELSWLRTDKASYNLIVNLQDNRFFLLYIILKFYFYKLIFVLYIFVLTFVLHEASNNFTRAFTQLPNQLISEMKWAQPRFFSVLMTKYIFFVSLSLYVTVYV